MVEVVTEHVEFVQPTKGDFPFFNGLKSPVNVKLKGPHIPFIYVVVATIGVGFRIKEKLDSRPFSDQ